MLHGKCIETTIYYGYCTGYKAAGIADEILDGSTQFLCFTETFERSLANHIITTLSICTIFVCQQSTVLFGQEESRAMAFTRMPSPNFVATSLAMNAVKLETPAFAAA